MKKLIMLGLAAAISSVVMASTTFYGETGLAVTPTAEVAPVDTLNIAADYLDNGGTALYPIRATYGIAENWEVGINYWMNGKMTSASAKWVTPLTAFDSKYAVGGYIDSYGSKTRLVHGLYGAMTKQLPLKLENIAVNLHAAVICHSDSIATTINPSIGVDATFAKAADLNIAAEYMFRGQSFAIKGSYSLDDGFGVQAGVTDFYAGRGQIFAGLNYTYDFTK